ncbi:MAG: hypothetical protein K9G67_02225 [Bacteroidales bacterium]|nr:hypothetical protein [Bacteroidales bacterium]MCF8344876.1 hypothetical protein [Bacteroidales bacterium]MCF8351750.1 hypothetical protein [Bacteroidales bacterium]MCF8375148.1 hypothetical protein [Bacteroidales bacterium]MCF8401849.1 hypothetical protein [Bacteroidales bacterium]
MLSIRAIYDGKKLKLIDKVKVSSPKKVILTFLEDPEDEMTYEELHGLAEESGALDFLEEEPELYSDDDLKVKYRK